MADLESAEFRTTMLFLKPESHARLTRMAKAARVRKTELARFLMNKGLRALKEEVSAPEWLDA